MKKKAVKLFTNDMTVYVEKTLKSINNLVE